MRPYVAARGLSFGIDPAIPPSQRYRVLGRIAIGGMAEIYLARLLTRSGEWREAVLKRLLPSLQDETEFIQMFYDEAFIASQLSHENIVEIFELGELSGSLFIAMEPIYGVSLEQLRSRSLTIGRRVPISVAVHVACGVLDALAYAHRFDGGRGASLNLVHRDVSPQNILVTYEGKVKLVDFGVAKAEGRLHRTRAGYIKGKCAYMAPEQVSADKIDGRADLFSLAATLFELLLNHHPFSNPHADERAMLSLIFRTRPQHPSEIDSSFPNAVSEILLRALESDPAERYQNAEAMRAALKEYLATTGAPSGSKVVADYVRSAFAERRKMMEYARREKDHILLVLSMRSEPHPESVEVPGGQESTVEGARRPEGSPKPQHGIEEIDASTELITSFRWEARDDFGVDPTLVDLSDDLAPGGARPSDEAARRRGQEAPRSLMGYDDATLPKLGGDALGPTEPRRAGSMPGERPAAIAQSMEEETRIGVGPPNPSASAQKVPRAPGGDAGEGGEKPMEGMPKSSSSQGVRSVSPGAKSISSPGAYSSSPPPKPISSPGAAPPPQKPISYPRGRPRHSTPQSTSSPGAPPRSPTPKSAPVAGGSSSPKSSSASGAVSTPGVPPSAAGQYAIVSKLGTGSMAEIYLARQTGYLGLQKNVVVKCLLPSLKGDRAAVATFFGDAKLGAQIQHANVMVVLDMGDVYEQYFVVVEHVEGWDLAKVLQICRAPARRFPSHVACRILSEACSALCAAYAASDEEGAPLGIVRREMKASDLLISSRGFVKLTNAWATRHRGGQGPSPDAGGVIFSLGVMLFEMLSATPFLLPGASDPDSSEARHRRRSFWHESGAPEPRDMLERLIDRATSRGPGLGYETLDDLQLDVERALLRIGVPVTAAHVGACVRELAGGGAHRSSSGGA